MEQHSWTDAYKLFLKSPSESFGIKVLPLVLLGVVPIVFADNILLPFVGLIDDIPTSLLVIFTVFRTWSRVREYR